MYRLGLAFLFGVVVSACGGSGDGQKTGSALTDCIPNQTFPCTCGLDTGTQSCTANRTLTTCDCTAKDAEAPSAPTSPAPTARCGNGSIDEGEACDDGNTVPGDGCSATCQPDGAPAEAAACPGQSVMLWPGVTTLAGTTSPFTDKFTASCGAEGGKDRRYLLEATADGTLTIEGSFAPGFDAVVEINENVCVNGRALVCENTFSAPFSRVVSVVAHRPYFLLVDGFLTADEGAYSLKLTLQ